LSMVVILVHQIDVMYSGKIGLSIDQTKKVVKRQASMVGNAMVERKKVRGFKRLKNWILSFKKRRT